VWRVRILAVYDAYMQLPNTLGALVVAVNDDLATAFAERPGIGHTSAAALASLSVRGPMNIEWLRRILGITHSACVRLVDRLEEGRLVYRRPAADRRAVELELTAGGQQAARELLQSRTDVIAAALAPLSPTEHAELERLVAKVLGAITVNRTNARHICRLCDHALCEREGACPVDAAATELER